MGLLDFLREAGDNLFGDKKGNEAAEIKQHLEKQLGSNVQNLGVRFDEGRVSLHGTAKSHAAKEKAALIAGNVKGVLSVDDDGLKVEGEDAPAGQSAGAVPAAAPSQYYTIEKGDSLSKISQQFYGDANRWRELFDANREVIQDPDKIYPGQKIRVPAA